MVTFNYTLLEILIKRYKEASQMKVFSSAYTAQKSLLGDGFPKSKSTFQE